MNTLQQTLQAAMVALEDAFDLVNVCDCANDLTSEQLSDMALLRDAMQRVSQVAMFNGLKIV